MFYAIRENDEETFYREIKHADINQVNEFGQNLLHEAVTHGQTKMGEALIAKGIDVNHRENKGQTPLHYAAVHGAFDLAKLILAKGGKLDIADTYGNQPLWTAVFNARGKYEMVELMMRYGADANHKNNSDRSPLDFANQIKDETLIKILTTK